jgi:hypothetical protein
MPAEGRSGGYSYQQDNSSAVGPALDEVARGLADGTISRRKALRLLGGALLGSMIASIPSVAWAANGGNSACAKFCRENFPPGRERGECISAGARGEGPCFEDGGGNCPNGGTCETGFPFGCQNSGNCFCTKTTEDTTFCSESSPICGGVGQACTSSNECPRGWACARTCCGDQEGPICNPPCGTIVGAGAASSADNQGMSGH